MTVVLATGNADKVREVREILEPHGIDVLSAAEAGGMPEVVEDRDTFAGNAAKKAVECARFLGRTVLADDSGLAVDALNGSPGVQSARFAGEHGNHAANIAKVLSELGDSSERQARFVCVLAVADATGRVETVGGEVRGTIARAPAGSGGFGYDPIFVPEDAAQTFAQLPPAAKHALSHRGNALRNLVDSGVLERFDPAREGGP